MRSDGKKIFGKERRANNRRYRVSKLGKYARTLTDSLISKYLPELTKDEVKISLAKYESGIDEIIQELQESDLDFKSYRLARDYLSKFISNGNKSEKWRLNLPPVLMRVASDKPTRSERWFDRAKKLNQWRKLWLEKLDSRHAMTKEMSESEVLGNTLISAAFHGGLCISEALSSLKTKLTEEKTPITQCGSSIWLDLVYKATSQPQNVIIGNETATLKRWFPDRVTLAWIHHFLKVKSDKTDWSELSAWNLIESQILSVDTKYREIRFKDICRYAVGVTENLENNQLHEVSVNYIVGNISSASLPFENYRAIMEEKFDVTHNAFQINNLPQDSKRKASGQTIATNYEQVISNIRYALRKEQSTGRKNTAQSARVSLNEILTKPLELPAMLLILWLIELLLNNKVSSVSRYFSSIGISWLSTTASVDLSELDAEQFESLYRDILDLYSSPKSRNYAAGRLRQFHTFLHRQHGMPFIQGAAISESYEKSLFVRAAYIPEAAFAAFLKSISISTLSDIEKPALLCFYTLAYRCGLRRGEIIKLRLKDIEQSEESWIFIRSNRYGNNKSVSALRKIPLKTLLLKHEFEAFGNYLAHRKRVAESSSSLLFSEPASPTLPISAHFISNVAKFYLSQIMKHDVVLHDLRHSALSKLQIILENDRELLKQHVNYPPQQLEAIRCIFGNYNSSAKRDIYWSLACFAGHQSPHTTLSSYLHFTDHIIANKVNCIKHNLSANVFREISGLSSNLITRTIRSNDLSCDEFELNWFDNIIQKKLRQFSTVIHKGIQDHTHNNDLDMIEISDEPEVHTKPSIQLCHRVLSDTEKGASIQELVAKFELGEELIYRWLSRAKQATNELQTTKKKSRVFSRFKKTPRTGVCLAPSLPQTNSELLKTHNAIETLKKIYRSDKEEIHWCIQYFFLNSNTSKSGIRFVSPNELSRFLTTMIKVFPKSHWRLELKPSSRTNISELKDVWQKHSIGLTIDEKDQFIAGKGNYQFGILNLLLVSQDKCVSSNILRYIFHMLYIMLDVD